MTKKSDYDRGFEDGRERSRHIHDILEIRLNEIIDKQREDLLEMGKALRELRRQVNDLKEQIVSLSSVEDVEEFDWATFYEDVYKGDF